jgi:hypothetical protein
MPRKPLFHPCDSSARKSPTRHKEFTKPLFDAHGLRVLGRAYDKKIIKEEVHGK